MKEIVTPEDFCWLYACGCLEFRHHAKTLSSSDYKTALQYITMNIFPKAEEVRAWFPNPFLHLEKDGGTCTLEQMQEFWRVDHFDPKQKSPVYSAQIKTIRMIEDGPELVQAQSISLLYPESRLLVASNMHRYCLKYNDVVFIHGFVVAEPLS